MTISQHYGRFQRFHLTAPHCRQRGTAEDVSNAHKCAPGRPNRPPRMHSVAPSERTPNEREILLPGVATGVPYDATTSTRRAHARAALPRRWERWGGNGNGGNCVAGGGGGDGDDGGASTLRASSLSPRKKAAHWSQWAPSPGGVGRSSRRRQSPPQATAPAHDSPQCRRRWFSRCLAL